MVIRYGLRLHNGVNLLQILEISGKSQKYLKTILRHVLRQSHFVSVKFQFTTHQSLPNSTTMPRRRNRLSRAQKRAKRDQANQQPKPEPKPTTTSTFTCQICFEAKGIRNKMPESSLGCGCGNDICVECFCTDFQARQKPIWINEHGMSQWNDPVELQVVLENEFLLTHSPEDENYDEAFGEHLLAHFHVGKRCAFCNQMGIWKLNQTPRVLPETGRLTMWPPIGLQPLPTPEEYSL